MTEELTSLELGDSHFYFLSEPMAIRIKEYEKMSDNERNDICTAFDKFGAGVRESLINSIKNSPTHDFFYGRRRFWAAIPSKFRTGNEQIRMVEEVRNMYNAIKGICEIHHTTNSAYILIPKNELNNPDVVHFTAFIQLTR